MAGKPRQLHEEVMIVGEAYANELSMCADAVRKAKTPAEVRNAALAAFTATRAYLAVHWPKVWENLGK